jgi:hypothetical protein
MTSTTTYQFHEELMLDTARRFTEAASDLLAMRLTSMLGRALSSHSTAMASPDLALGSCSDSLDRRSVRSRLMGNRSV